MNKIINLCSIFFKFCFIPIVQIGTLPFVTMEHHVKMPLFQKLKFIHASLSNNFINIF